MRILYFYELDILNKQADLLIFPSTSMDLKGPAAKRSQHVLSQCVQEVSSHAEHTGPCVVLMLISALSALGVRSVLFNGGICKEGRRLA